jgi:hypothetical protein
MSKLLKGKTIPLIITIITLVITIALIFYAVNNFFGEEAETEPAATASGRHNLSFDVFYIENDIWESNPIPHEFSFLMSFTDYVEVTSGFLVNISEEVDIQYEFEAVKHFIVRHSAAGFDASGAVLFQEYERIAHSQGSRRARAINFNARDADSPGGVFHIAPHEYLQQFADFENYHSQRGSGSGFRGLLGEVALKFTYTISIPELGIDQSATMGYSFPLNSEVFVPSIVGTPSFEWESPPVHTPPTPLIAFIGFVAIFVLSVSGLLYGVKLLTQDDNKNIQLAKDIFRKYSSEIVIYDEPIDMRLHIPKEVSDFGELLKTAVNLNKHIMCYKTRERVEFVTIVDNYAIHYMIDFTVKAPPPSRKK